MHGVREVPFLRRFAQGQLKAAWRKGQNLGSTPCKNRARIAVPDQDRQGAPGGGGRAGDDDAIGVRQGGEATERGDDAPAGFVCGDLIAAIPHSGLVWGQGQRRGGTAAELSGFAQDQDAIGDDLDSGSAEGGGERRPCFYPFGEGVEALGTRQAVVSGGA